MLETQHDTNVPEANGEQLTTHCELINTMFQNTKQV